MKPERLKPDLKILLIRTDRIGDVVLSSPVAAAIKRAIPNADVTFLVRQYTRDLISLHEDVDRVLTEEEIGAGEEAVRKLKMFRFDAGIALHPDFKWAWRMYRAGIPLRLGTGYRFFSIFYNRKVFEHRKHTQVHEADHNLNLLKPLGIPVSPAVFRFKLPVGAAAGIRSLLEKKGWDAEKTLVVLHPGSGGSAADWPAKRFGELARALLARHIFVVLTGNAAEKNLVDRVAQIGGAGVVRLDGALNLVELSAVLKQASVVVANSTGPLHIAVAFGTDVVGLYCPVPPCHPERWGPYGRSDSVLVPQKVSCKTCDVRICAKTRCMEQISVEMVLNKVLKNENV